MSFSQAIQADEVHAVLKPKASPILIDARTGRLGLDDLLSSVQEVRSEAKKNGTLWVVTSTFAPEGGTPDILTARMNVRPFSTEDDDVDPIVYYSAFAGSSATLPTTSFEVVGAKRDVAKVLVNLFDAHTVCISWLPAKA